MEIINKGKDWALEKVGDFADYEKGKKPKNQSPIQTDIFKYPYVNIQAFEKGTITSYTDGEKCNFCSENDFLMVWDGSRFGLIGKGIKGATGSTLMKINFPGIENHFAYYFLKSKYLEINSKPKGTGTPHVNPDLLWNYIFPIAPLPEQRAIVSKIEQLFSDLDNGIENFEKAQEQLKRYRQSVLKIACEGKLVPTEAELARADGRDYEPAGVLLARILKERREKWEVEKKRKGRKSAKYKEPAASDVSDLPGLPEGWCWTTGDAIFWFVTSGSRGWAKYYSDSGPIFLRVGNLDHDSTAIDLSNIQRVQPPAGAEGNRTCIIVGDVLISITADIGMIALVPEDIEEAYINQHVALARPVSTISPSYLAWFLSSQEGGQKQFLKLQRGATKMGLGLDDIRAVNVPLPPLPEQRRIVTELERRLSLCDKMEATIAESFEKAESLRQSILKKSFEGKLLSEKELEEVRNAPDWEPAEKLLERIKAEKKIISKEK